MTDAEISRRLALAIGWENVAIHEPTNSVWVFDNNVDPKTFDYRDPAVIWPIAEEFNSFPVAAGLRWFAAARKAIHPVNRTVVEADTAAKAVALAVIKAKEQK